MESVPDLSQAQVNSANGNSFTKIPSDLFRPGHWQTIRQDEGQGGHTNDQMRLSIGAHSDEPTSKLREQIVFLQSLGGVGSATAENTARYLEEKILEISVNSEEDLETLRSLPHAYRSLARALKIAEEGDRRIAELEATIRAQKAEIERLTRVLSDHPSFSTQVFAAALGGAGATLLTSSAGFFFGAEGTEIIQNIWDWVSGLNSAPAPASAGEIMPSIVDA